MAVKFQNVPDSVRAGFTRFLARTSIKGTARGKIDPRIGAFPVHRFDSGHPIRADLKSLVPNYWRYLLRVDSFVEFDVVTGELEQYSYSGLQNTAISVQMHRIVNAEEHVVSPVEVTLLECHELRLLAIRIAGRDGDRYQVIDPANRAAPVPTYGVEGFMTLVAGRRDAKELESLQSPAPVPGSLNDIHFQ